MYREICGVITQTLEKSHTSLRRRRSGRCAEHWLRTAIPPSSRGHDFSCVLRGRRGPIVAMAETTPSTSSPCHEVGQMLERSGATSIRRRFIHNDPLYWRNAPERRGDQLPLFHGERMAVLPLVRAHWGDVGRHGPGEYFGKNTRFYTTGAHSHIGSSKGTLKRASRLLLHKAGSRGAARGFLRHAGHLPYRSQAAG